MGIGASRIHRGLADALATGKLHRRINVYDWDADIVVDININGVVNGTPATGRLLSHVESSN